MEALAGTTSSSLLPAFPAHHHQPPSCLALRARRCGPLRAAAAPGGGKDDAQAGATPNGSPVIKSKSDSSQNGVLGPITTDKSHTPLSTHTTPDSSGSRAGLFRTPISGGVQSATFAHDLPPPALAVRNLMEQARFAHLCTVMSGMHHRRTGYPFGSLVDFSNDSMGHPIFSLSPLAIHTRNLLSEPRCTLVVQVPGWSGLSNARVTIFGDVYPLTAEQQEWAHKQYVAKHQQWASQQWGNFYYYRMQNISDIYFIGGFGTVAWVDVKEYEAIQPDKIAVDGGEQSLKELNVIFSKPLREFLSSEGEVDDAALISVDSKGIDIRVRQGAQFNIQRLAFDVPHKVMRTSTLRIQPLLQPAALHPLLPLLHQHLLQLDFRLMQCHITQLDRATSTYHGATSTCHGTMCTCHGATACANQEFKLDTFWAVQFGISLTALTSNDYNFRIRRPLEVHEYLMER